MLIILLCKIKEAQSKQKKLNKKSLTKKAKLFLSQAFETKNGNKKSFSFFVKHFLSMSQAFFVIDINDNFYLSKKIYQKKLTSLLTEFRDVTNIFPFFLSSF